VSDWLVPVSRHVRFGLASGRTVESGFSKLQDAAISGRLSKVMCDVRGSLVDVWSGDVVWFYTEELEVGVFAVGRAHRPTKTNTPTVTITIDLPHTRLLAADPLPATTMRRWVPELRQGAVALDLRPRALAVLEAWQVERAERDADLLGVIGVTPWRAATKRRKAGTTQLAQDDVLGPVARLLRSQDFAIGVIDGAGDAPLLIARRVRDIVIVNVERSRGASGRAAALAAYGAVRERKWRLERESARDLRLRVSLWTAFVARPHEDVVAFLEDEDVLVSWQHRKGIVELTDRSKQRWYQYLGVR
jgi:hypothetical protein